MNYQEFINLRKEKKIFAGIDNSEALKLVRYLPKRNKAAIYFWSGVWLLSIPGFILLAIFWKWYIGIPLLLIITPILFRANKKSASQFVLEHAEANQSFFDLLMEHNLLIFKESGTK